MTRIIDNSNEKLSAVLSDEIKNVNEVAIASAYFNVRGFSLLMDSLSKIPLRLLLGREPGSNIAYQDEILSELEKEVMENEDDMTFFAEVKEALNYFNKDYVQIRIVKDGFFHGKAYMGASPSLSSIRNGFAATGSSNFTYGGLYSNRELNMLATDREAIEELSRWFYNIWNGSQDFKSDFISFLSNYVTAHSPFEIVAKALYETLKDRMNTAESLNTIKSLYPHQRLSVSQAWDLVNKHRGVVIADPVGLGKTRVGISLAYMAIQQGLKPMVIAPKTILDTTWKKEMNEVLSMHLPSVSTEGVSKDPDILSRDFNDKNFIIIDEAHYFRTSSSRRFEGLADYLSKKDRKIILITATPINNSLMDLHNLLTLFVNDDGVPDISPSLKGFFTEQQKKLLNGEKIDIDPLLKKFVVRISRETAVKVSNGLRFPSRVIDTDGTSYTLYPSPDIISNYIEKLALPYYDLAVDKQVRGLKLPDGSPMEEEQQALSKERLKELVRNVITYNYFKRLESSVFSLRRSLERLKSYIEMTLVAADKEGKFIPPKFKDRVYQDEDGIDFSGIPNEQLEMLTLTDDERTRYIGEAEKDQEIINEVLGLLNNVNDMKVKTLIKKVSSLNIEKNNGVIIFTSFADTAEYIYSELKKIDSIETRLMLTTGKRAEGFGLKDRNDIINHFMDNGGILISTDVLSAGQNLQNAQFLINYDLPWNPVILIQRAGRIDRLRSPYDKIYIMTISPQNRDENDPTSIDHFIRLMTKLTRKIEGIRQGIGSDVSILGEEPMPKDFNILLEIIRGNGKELDSLEETGKSIGIISWESPFDIYEDIKEQLGEEKIRTIPIGSGAFKDYERNGIFILYRSGEKKEDYNYHWVLKFEDGELITDQMKIIEILMQQPRDNKGETIEYDMLKSEFKKALDSFLKDLEEKSKKPIRQMPKDLRNIIDYAQKNSSLVKYIPSLVKEQGNTNLIKVLKKALEEGRLKEELERVFPNPLLQIQESDDTSVPKNLHRIVWCLLRGPKGKPIQSKGGEYSGLAVQRIFKIEK